MSLVSTTCFGKVPSRGDFVKGVDNHQLISVLDRWVSQAMNQLSEDPHWKAAYDSAPSIDYLFVGASSRLSVVGHLAPSKDLSGRRFPFLAAATVEREDSLIFRSGPAGLEKSLIAMAHQVAAGIQGQEIAETTLALAGINCAQDFETTWPTDPLGNFVRRQSIASLAGLLRVREIAVVRRIILAIGLLMRPALGRSQVDIAKDLILPLPFDPHYRRTMAAGWLYLVTAFLRGTLAELEVLIVHDAVLPKLIISFNGSSPGTLAAALAPKAFAEQTVPLLDPEWVDQQAAITDDYGVAKLSSYLTQAEVSIEQAFATFREVFLGE